MTDAGTVMAMVRERQDVLDALLKDASTLAKGIKELAVSTQADLDSLLVDLDTVTTTLTEQKKDLDEVIRLAGPTMRVYNKGPGDGPWTGDRKSVGGGKRGYVGVDIGGRRIIKK